MATWEVGVPMLNETLKREDKCFNFACRAASECFDGRFVLEEEIFGSESPSNCGRIMGLKRGGHGSSSNSAERGVARPCCG